MSEDVKIEGVNLSALLRNFDRLRATVKEQGEIINTQKKDLQIAFFRIDRLSKDLEIMKSDAVSQLFGKYK